MTKHILCSQLVYSKQTICLADLMKEPHPSQPHHSFALQGAARAERLLSLAQYTRAVRLANSFAGTRNPLKRAWLAWRAGVLLLRTRPAPTQNPTASAWVILLVLPFVVLASLALLTLGVRVLVQGPLSVAIAVVTVCPNVLIGLRGASFLRRLLDHGIPQKLTPLLSSGPGQEKRAEAWL